MTLDVASVSGTARTTLGRLGVHDRAFFGRGPRPLPRGMRVASASPTPGAEAPAAARADDPPPMRDVADADGLRRLLHDRPGRRPRGARLRRAPAAAERPPGEARAAHQQGEAAKAKALDVMSDPPAGFDRLSAAETKDPGQLLAKATAEDSDASGMEPTDALARLRTTRSQQARRRRSAPTTSPSRRRARSGRSATSLNHVVGGIGPLRRQRPRRRAASSGADPRRGPPRRRPGRGVAAPTPPADNLDAWRVDAGRGREADRACIPGVDIIDINMRSTPRCTPGTSPPPSGRDPGIDAGSSQRLASAKHAAMGGRRPAHKMGAFGPPCPSAGTARRRSTSSVALTDRPRDSLRTCRCDPQSFGDAMAVSPRVARQSACRHDVARARRGDDGSGRRTRLHRRRDPRTAARS